ncbi:MAG: electron transport complex subunit RsxB [Alphaproteobacteria bacterium]|nr:electron transport complex subunit RsxB [Alphaproteobacteria bacterium]
MTPAGRGGVVGLSARLLDALPQTQCQRCGYPDCAGYAQAIASGVADINQCPPGGAEGVFRLALILSRESKPLNPTHGLEGPMTVAVIDEDWCIGCTLCMEACPTDAILGANKRMHTVVAEHCTGCDLCLPACPVDCIQMESVSGTLTGWQAWSAEQAGHARQRYQDRNERLAQREQDRALRHLAQAQEKWVHLPEQTRGLETLPQGDPDASAEAERKRTIIQAAMARAQKKLQQKLGPL